MNREDKQARFLHKFPVYRFLGRFAAYYSFYGIFTTWYMLLDTLQGVPLGLTFGSIPFLLSKQLSYAQMATFSLATYPYSLKLLWSPIVDSVYVRSFGRRKSWIVPMQVLIGALMIWLGQHIDDLVEKVVHHVNCLDVCVD